MAQTRSPKPNLLRENLGPLGFYALTAFLAFSPCLLAGRVYIDNDLIIYYSHFRSLLRSQLAQGHFPLWNPYLLGGQPFFADPNAMMAYPLQYLTLLLPIPYGLGVFFFLHMTLAAWGTHRWLPVAPAFRKCLPGRSAYFFIVGLFLVGTDPPPILAALAWFPWLLFSLEKLSAKPASRAAFLAGLCFAVVFCCGNFQSTTYIFYAALFYFSFRLIHHQKIKSLSHWLGFLARRSFWKKHGLVFLFLLWGTLPLLIQLVPTLEFSKYSNRLSAGLTYDNFNGTFSMVPRTLYEFLFPAYGLPEGGVLSSEIQKFDGPGMDNAFLANLGYLGIWIPLLAFFAFRQKNKKIQIFLLGGCLLAVFCAWGRYFPLHRLLCVLVPGINLSRAPVRFLEVYALFGAALAAYGYQVLEEKLQSTQKMTLLKPALLYGGILLAWGLTRPGHTWREIIALILGTAGLLLWKKTKSWRNAGPLLFGSSLVLSLLLNGWNGFSPTAASGYDYENRFPVFSFLKTKPRDGRYFFDPSLYYLAKSGTITYACEFPEDTVMEFGLRSVGGYNPIFLKKTAELKNLPIPNYSRLMAVRGFLLSRPVVNPSNFYQRVFDTVYFYEPIHPPAYVNAPSRWEVFPDDGTDLKVLARKGFDPAQEAILTRPLPGSDRTSSTGKKADLRYQLVKDETDDQVFRVQLSGGSLVTFSEILFPGWKAWVDGQPAELLTANHAFRALILPAGDHQVEFRYIPGWLYPLLWFIILWSLSALVYLAVILFF